MNDIQTIDHYADRQAGVDRRPAPKPTARRRARQVTPPASELPPATDGEHYARLDLGRAYHLVSPEMTFERGVVRKISKAVYDHLVNNVDLRRDTYRDPQYGRITRVRHPFTFSPPIPPYPDETPDLD